MLNNLKKITMAVFAFITAIFLVSCAMPKDKVISSLGEYEDHVFFTWGEFQDYTDYAKYYYNCSEVDNNQYLKRMQESDFAIFNRHLDDFEAWIEILKDGDASREIVVNYDFVRAIMDTEDYIYIDSEEKTRSDGKTTFIKYNIYFFDAQTQILYYFHNNL